MIYPQQPPPSTGSAASTTASTKLQSSKKSSPQFRWRRRKRRSKAQYPEMSRYLLPIDDGEEVQHLGRTLECTLCGLRGKRCHLTLHFKAKHNEVIDLAGVHGTRKNNVSSSSSKKASSASAASAQLNRGDLCWQPPNVVNNVEAGPSPPTSSPGRPQSANQPPDHLQQNRGHLSTEANEEGLVVKLEPAVLHVRVQGTSQKLASPCRVGG